MTARTLTRVAIIDLVIICILLGISFVWQSEVLLIVAVTIAVLSSIAYEILIDVARERTSHEDETDSN